MYVYIFVYVHICISINTYNIHIHCRLQYYGSSLFLEQTAVLQESRNEMYLELAEQKAEKAGARLRSKGFPMGSVYGLLPSLKGSELGALVV